jgi:DNA-binding MarR family transcriptional regulator
MVSLLQAKGLVQRQPHPQDRRAFTISLSPSGIRLAEDAWRSSSNLRTELVTIFQESELRTLIEFLDRLAGAMQPPGRRPAGSRRLARNPGSRLPVRRNRSERL